MTRETPCPETWKAPPSPATASFWMNALAFLTTTAVCVSSLYIHTVWVQWSLVDRRWTYLNEEDAAAFSGLVAAFFEKLEPETTRMLVFVRATVPRCPRLLRNLLSSMAMLDAFRALTTLGPASFTLRENFADLRMTFDPEPMTIGTAPALFNAHSLIMMSEMSTAAPLHS